MQASLPPEGEHADSLLTASMCCLQLRRILDDMLDFDKAQMARRSAAEIIHKILSCSFSFLHSRTAASSSTHPHATTHRRH